MKRRVLREHANKRYLRLLSAEHGLRHDAYNVLCDASFLRAVALAEGNATCSPAQSLRALMRNTFAAANSHVRQEEESGVSSGETAKSKNLILYISYLPETATALRRLIQQQEEKQSTPLSFLPPDKKRNKLIKEQTKLTVTTDKRKKKSIVDIAESLLLELECVGHAEPAEHKNEAKAIAKFVVEMLSGQGQPRTVQGRRNGHFFFVATQSHDVRRLLPSNAALIRLMTFPTALRIERNADAFHYDKSNTANMLGNSESTPVGGKRLSPADVAFIQHLSKDLLPGVNTNKTRRVMSRSDVTRASGDVAVATGEKKGTQNVADFVIMKGRKFQSKKKRQHRPNPLAVKKKRVREVLRVDTKIKRKGN